MQQRPHVDELQKWNRNRTRPGERKELLGWLVVRQRAFVGHRFIVCETAGVFASELVTF